MTESNACAGTTTKLVAAHTLKEDDRILLKDLRILTVTALVKQTDGHTIRYYDLARAENGSLAVVKGQMVRLLVEGGAAIDNNLVNII